MGNIANKIEAKDKTLYSIFSENRYKIDVFQREYRWQPKQIESLVDDLTSGFMSSYNPSDDIDKVDNYDSYYMGPLVLCKDKSECSIVDGQQRLTSFALLLVYLQHLQEKVDVNDELRRDLCEQLYIKRGGKLTFILNVKERTEIMEKLLAEEDNINNILQSIESGSNAESLENLVLRYEDIRRCFPSEIKNPDVLPLFIEWLLFKVVFVEVMAYSTEKAYTIFETMNDRGLSLNPTEILKAFILSKIEDEARSEEMNDFWKEKVSSIKYKTGADGDLSFFRAWFRAKYAQTISSRQQGAMKEDFEEIGTQFHRWFKENLKKIGLKESSDFYYFIKSDLDFYSKAFLKIQKFVNKECDNKWSKIFVTNCFPLADSLYWPLMMSPLSVYDSEQDIDEKLLIVNDFVDCYINRRQLSFKSINQSSIRNYIYELVKKIRDLNFLELKDVLYEEKKKLTSVDCMISSAQGYSQPYLHYFFARLKHHIYPSGDFYSLMRSKKQSSYILLQIFTYEDCQTEILSSQSYPSWGISNYCLIRRYDFENIPSGYQERINWLMNKGYLPEMEMYGNLQVSDFFSKRFELLGNSVDLIWPCNNSL